MNTRRKDFRCKSWLLITLLLIAALLQPASASAAATTYTFSQIFPLDLWVYVPCAAGGAGELVQLHGKLHDLFSMTFDSSDGIHGLILDNPQGVTGRGMTTGARYQGTGESRDTFSTHSGFQETFVNNFKMIGQGKGNNFTVHETLHFTINPDGTVTTYVDHFIAVCH